MEASTLEKLAQEEKKREEVTSLYLTLKKIMLKRKKIGNNVCKKEIRFSCKFYPDFDPES